MAAQNYDQHAVGSLLQNTLQLQRRLIRSHPGMTEQSQQVIHTIHQQQRSGSGGAPSTVGLGLGTTIGSGNGGIATTHGHVTSGVSRPFSSSSSLNGPGSPRSKAILASPPVSTVPRPPPSSTATSSPTKSSFSSPQLLRLPSASTFTPYHDRPQQNQPDPTTTTSDQVGSLPTDKGTPSLSVNTTALPPPSKSVDGSSYTRHYTKSLTAGTNQAPHLSPQSHTRRPKNSLGALANIDLSGRFPHHLPGAHDPEEDNSTISIRVRFVSKDLWIWVDIPRNISVLKARDLVLEKCQLSTTPPSAPSSLSEAALADDDSTATLSTTKAEETVKMRQGIGGDIKKEIPLLDTAATDKPEQKEQKEEAADQDPDRMPTTRSGKGTHKSTSHSDNQPSHSEQSLAKSTRSDINTGGHDKIARHPHISPDEQDLQQKAAAVVLVARLEMFSVCINGFGDEAAKINYAKAITSQSQPNSVHDVPPGTSNPGPRKVQQQLKRLVPSSSIHNDDNHHHGMSPPDRSSREVGTGRLGNIYAWWDRHNSHSGKYIGRDMVDHGDMSVDCPKQGQTLQSEASKKELDAWRASLGLFWVAAGHWLDDSRTVSSYHLQPQDLLELQFRDHYIHLPNYKDHYAEGVIFKLSKKSRPVSMLTSHGGKESLGVWKERWIVLQGSKLLIYHKRKDTTKKTIELPIPLHVASSTLQHPRHSFRASTQSSATMSSTTIALTMSSDPHVPKLCFRGTNDHDMNHWIRIFNSLNNNTGPLTSPTSLNTRIGSPNLGSSYPMSSSIPDSSRSHASALASYPSERKRNHTLNNMFSNSAATMPSIDPVVISNAEVAISSMNSSSNNGHGNNSNGANYSNSNHHYRNVSQTTNISSSALDNRDLNLLQHHPLTTSTKEDTRRRAITEPNRFRPLNAQHSRGNTKNAPKTALEVDTSRSLDLSSVSEAPFRLDSPPGSRKRRPVLGTECLDSASQALLATSSARSSMALIYSGYVWIYVPNVPFTTGEMKEESNGQQNRQSDLLSKDTVLDISATSPMSSSRTFVDHTNNSGGSASASAGRYVKCFATINDHGHLHWVEVKKQNDLESEQELGSKLKGTPSRSYYGIQLKPKKLAEAERDMDQRSLNGNVSVESCPLSPESISGTLKPSTELIQVSVAHRLRLFFFCIKVTPSALTEVLLNIAEATTGLAIPATGSRNNTSPSITSTATNVAAKIRHRLSSSLSTLATSGLPPLPSMKPQSLSGSVSKGKNMGRPSMTSPHDRELTSVAHHSQQQQQQHQQRQQHQQSQSLHPDRAMSASSESVRPVSHKSSSMSLKSTLSNITTAPAMVGGSSPLLFPSKDGDQQQQHSQFASPTSAEPASPSSSSSSSSSSSNVLSLAQNLQKAVLMNRGQSVSSDGCPGSNGDGSEEHSAAQLAQSSPSSSTNRKLTLSEVTVANQPALPDSAETLEQARSLQEQTVQQRFQRAEERSRAKSQQYNLQQHHQQSQQQQYRQQQQHFQSQEPSKIRSDTSNSESINSACPFLEMNEDVDGSGESFVTLKGYTETEDGWRAWQSALERFLDGPIREQNSALPPEDTLIPSYHSPPEVQLSEKAQRFLSAKESLIGEVNLAVVEVGRAPTPDIMSAGAIPTLNDPTTQTRATSSSLTRWMHLSGGGGAGGAGGGGSVDRGDKNKVRFSR
ncbi:hypothetical protein EDD21DRAFT_122682 [Dissophora ornata]|nr:hypothetical protein EDD21DRAFT_122682 [Dissophora ornata]